MGWRGDISSLVHRPLPPRLVLQAANMLQVIEMCERRQDSTTIWWLPPSRESAWPTMTHYVKGGPVYDDALSKVGSVPGLLLLKLPPPTAPPR